MNPWNKQATTPKAQISWGPASPISPKSGYSSKFKPSSPKQPQAFAQKTQSSTPKVKEPTEIASVLVDPLFLLKIQDQAHQNSKSTNSSELSFGIALGIESSELTTSEEKEIEKDVLEVTGNVPVRSLKTISTKIARDELFHKLRDLPIDYNCVGMYVNCSFGNFCDTSIIKTFATLQNELDVHGKARSVLIVYDYEIIAFKAYRVDLTKQQFLLEVPVLVRSGIYDKVFTAQLLSGSNRASVSRLSLELENRLEGSFERILEQLAKVESDDNKKSYYNRLVSKQMQQRNKWLQERKEENKLRAKKGLNLLPEYDGNDPVWKDLSSSKPDEIDEKIRKQQVSIFCDILEDFSAATLPKVYLTK
eukprot:augustus_masked-scaffold_27-processed-gene-2.6-mRNA-1 protein AED:0.99 eAED:1.00 QI:0/-1/0/1/-1/1/1/0/362